MRFSAGIDHFPGAKEYFELLEEVIVEEPVEERIGTGRRHSKHVEKCVSTHKTL